MKVVAVFSGGGAKAIAHAGAWRAISEAGHQVTHIVATSFGAVIGAMFAAGSSYDDLIRNTTGLQTRDVAPIDLLGLVKGMFAAAILKPEPLRRTIARLVPAQRFADLRIPLTVTTTDLDSGEQVVFPGDGRRETDVPLQDVLYASCALPLYYPPLQIDGRRLGDGGIRVDIAIESFKFKEGNRIESGWVDRPGTWGGTKGAEQIQAGVASRRQVIG